MIEAWKGHCIGKCWNAKGKRCRCKCEGKFHGRGNPDYIGTQKRMSIWADKESKLKSNLNFGEHFKPDKKLLKLVY